MLTLPRMRADYKLANIMPTSDHANSTWIEGLLLLLGFWCHRQQAPDMVNGNLTIINLKDVARFAAGIAENNDNMSHVHLSIHDFRREHELLVWKKVTNSAKMVGYWQLCAWSCFWLQSTVHGTHTSLSNGSLVASYPASKQQSVNSILWCSPRLTGADLKDPSFTRHSRMLSRPQDTILLRGHMSGNSST